MDGRAATSTRSQPRAGSALRPRPWRRRAGGSEHQARVQHTQEAAAACGQRSLDHFVDNVNWITPQGWLLTLDHGTRDAFLRSAFTSRTVRLPRDEESILPGSKNDTVCFLSTRRPTDPGCVVLVVHRTEPTFCYCRPVGSSGSGGSSRWYKHVYRPEEIDQDRDDVIRSMASLVGAASDGPSWLLGYSQEYPTTLLIFSLGTSVKL
ncbi:hypothetical protein EJB05_42902, partial [Eragrostis curvula]